MSSNLTRSAIRPLGQAAKTSDFQSGIVGSTPAGVTIFAVVNGIGIHLRLRNTVLRVRISPAAPYGQVARNWQRRGL